MPLHQFRRPGALDVRRFPESINVEEEIPFVNPIQSRISNQLSPENLPIPRQNITQMIPQEESNLPTREDYRPSLLRKILAGAAGASAGYQSGAGEGIRVGREIVDQPYNEALRDYQVGSAEDMARREQERREEETGIKGRIEDRAVRGEESVYAEREARTGAYGRSNQPRDPQKTAMEKNLRLYEELQQTPEGRELWDNFNASGEESFDEWARKQDYQQQGREDLAELTASLRPEKEENQPSTSDVERVEDAIFDEMADDPNQEFAYMYAIEKDNRGQETIHLRTEEELMEKFGWTRGQAKDEVEKYYDEFNNRKGRKLGESGFNRYELEEREPLQ